jgi:transposase-like protein
MTYEETKKQIIEEYLAGGVSLRTLAKQYNRCPTSIYRWIMAERKQNKKREVLNPKPIIKKPLPELESMSTDVAWLQQELRISQIKILLLEATIDISDEQFGTDIRKKVGPRQS